MSEKDCLEESSAEKRGAKPPSLAELLNAQDLQLASVPPMLDNAEQDEQSDAKAA